MSISKRSNLVKLREKYDESKAREEAFSKSTITLKKGDNNIRLCPPPKNDDCPFTEMDFHYNIGGNEKNVALCTLEERGHCVICEDIEGLRNTSDENDLALAKSMSRKHRYMWNAICTTNGEEAKKGVQQLLIGTIIQNQIQALIHNARMPEIDDPDVGVELCINRTGEGRDTKYTTSAYPRETTEPNPMRVKEQMNNAPAFKSLLWYYTDEELKTMLTGAKVKRGEQANGSKQEERSQQDTTEKTSTASSNPRPRYARSTPTAGQSNTKKSSLWEE